MYFVIKRGMKYIVTDDEGIIYVTIEGPMASVAATKMVEALIANEPMKATAVIPYLKEED